MIEVINPSHDPYFNLALEEYLVKSWTGPKNLFVLWQNQPAVIIGRNQNAIEEVNLPYLEQEGIALVRRMSGGGAVYHDSGNLNYTLVLDDSQDFANFDKFTRPVIKALKKIGVKAENSGRNDITIKGLKFSGNAQFKYRGRLLHHGTILFDSNLDIMTQVLNPGEHKIASKGIKSVRSRVTNICEHLSQDLTVEEFKEILARELLHLEPGSGTCELAPSDLQAVEALRENKYATWAWNYGHSPAFNLRKTASLAWGHIDIRLEVKHGRIGACRKFLLVAQMTLTSTGIMRLSPIRVMFFSCSTRNRLTCCSKGISPISSRNRVPPVASSNFPSLPPLRAPVKAPSV
jgi:lipoate-protein ligase A